MLAILNDKKLSEELEEYCANIIKKNGKNPSSDKKETPAVEAEHSEDESEENESDDESNDSEQESVDKKAKDDNSDGDEKCESCEELDDLNQTKVLDDTKSEESDDSGIEVEEITTKNGRQLYYDKENNRVLEPEGDGEGAELGELIKTTNKDADVEYDGEFYFIGRHEKYNGVEYTICALSDKVFDSKMKLVGSVVKNDPLEIKLKKKK